MVDCFKNRKVLMVMAHPDDEIIFGWPILQDPSIEKALVVCSSDLNNPKRTHVRNRRYVLEEICKRLHITDFKCFDYPSEFYRLPTRDETLKRMLEEIKNYVLVKEQDHTIFTHNVFGEYGNIDHQLTHYLCGSSVKHILYTNIQQESNWLPFPRNNNALEIFFNNKIISCTLDNDFYKECSNLYKEKKCWTWDKPPIDNCGIFLL